MGLIDDIESEIDEMTSNFIDVALIVLVLIYRIRAIFLPSCMHSRHRHRHQDRFIRYICISLAD